MISYAYAIIVANLHARKYKDIIAGKLRYNNTKKKRISSNKVALGIVMHACIYSYMCACDTINYRDIDSRCPKFRVEELQNNHMFDVYITYYYYR